MSLIRVTFTYLLVLFMILSLYTHPHHIIEWNKKKERESWRDRLACFSSNMDLVGVACKNSFFCLLLLFTHVARTRSPIFTVKVGPRKFSSLSRKPITQPHLYFSLSRPSLFYPWFFIETERFKNFTFIWAKLFEPYYIKSKIGFWKVFDEFENNFSNPICEV